MTATVTMSPFPSWAPSTATQDGCDERGGHHEGEAPRARIDRWMVPVAGRRIVEGWSRVAPTSTNDRGQRLTKASSRENVPRSVELA